MTTTLVLGIILAASIGGIVEIAPLFTIHSENGRTRRTCVSTRRWSRRPEYLHPRGVLSLPLADDPGHIERRGRPIRPYSLAVEIKYDHPMLWGSKRIGPDLARIGGKYSDEWQTAHLRDPRAVVPGPSCLATRFYRTRRFVTISVII